MKYITCDYKFGSCKKSATSVVKLIELNSQLLMCTEHAKPFILDKEYVVYTISIDEGIDIKKFT